VDPSAFIWVHAQHGSQEGIIEAAERGVWISLDNVNGNRSPDDRFSIGWYADRLLAMKEAGMLDKVLISHDAGWYSPGEENGGNFRGFTDIHKRLSPALKQKGFTDQDLDQLLVINPRESLTLR
jgi:phosphotriesterase-related protein